MFGNTFLNFLKRFTCFKTFLSFIYKQSFTSYEYTICDIIKIKIDTTIINGNRSNFMKPVVLTILDGFGLSDELKGNAIKQAHLPTFDYLWNDYPHCELIASGREVGLPDGQMGNSEVGHLNIGAGRIVYQPLQIITNSIVDNSFYENEALLDIIKHVKNNDSKLHIMGLVSDGGVHSHINHIFALLRMAKKHDIKKLYIHVFTDGRDTLPDVAKIYVKQLQDKTDELKIGKIASIAGRFYAMDRDHKWDRTKLAIDVMVNGVGPFNSDVFKVIDSNLKHKKTDEFIIPTLIDKNGIIESNDGIWFANFRTDRATQLLVPITKPNRHEVLSTKLENIKLTSLMPCSHLVKGTSAFLIEDMQNTLGSYLSDKGLSQLRIAETEKFAHVTFFFDGGKELTLDNCNRALILSPKVETYDLQPKMSAYEVTNDLLAAIDDDAYDFILLNFANADMVGHTGNLYATINGLEFVDSRLRLIYEKIKEKHGLLIVTADHGNAEDKTMEWRTSHTKNDVPFILVSENAKLKKATLQKGFGLKDIAPTVLDVLKIKQPKEMTGKSIIK